MLREKADYYAKNPVKIDPKTGRPVKPPKTEAKTPDKKPDGPEPYDPSKNEKKTPDEDEGKDVIEEYK
jgi:hypothetical protein